MLKRQPNQLALLACCIGFGWSQSARTLLYSIMPAVSTELGLDAARVGLIAGTLSAGYVVGIMISTLVPLGRRATVSGGFLLSLLASLGFALVSSLLPLLILSFISGMGLGFYLPRGASVIADVCPPENRARAMALHEVAANVGMMLASLFAGWCLRFMPWRAVMTLGCTVGLVAALAFWFWVPDSAGQTGETAAREPLRLDGRTPALALIGGTSFMTLVGFVAMLPTMVHVGFAVDPAASAGFVGWIRLWSMPGALVGGWLADRLGRTQSLTLSYAISLVSMLALSFVPYGILFGCLVVLAVAMASSCSTIYYTLLGDTYRAGQRERILSIVSPTASLMGGVMTPMLLGLILDATSARTTLLASLTGPVLGLLALAWFLAARRAAMSRAA